MRSISLSRLTSSCTTIIATVTAGVLFSAILTACTIDTGKDSDSTPSSQQMEAKGQTADTGDVITANIADGDQSVSVADLVRVSSTKKLNSVALMNDAGQKVKGDLSPDGTMWTATEKLGYGRSYTLKAATADKDFSAAFTTQSPAKQTNAALAPLDGATVGIGQSVSFQFDTPIQDRQAVQDLISVETTPHVDGAFYWISSETLRWRPAEYWKPGTTVKVNADLYGHDLGGGVYGEVDRSATFTIGDALRAVVDDAAKKMTIYKNGKVIQTMPVSDGRDGGRWATPNGIYQVGDQYETLNMDSTTYGYSYAEGGYSTDVNFATQMSYSGIYIHGAPWSVWAQGNTNTSHGCINVSDENAQWVYKNFKRGDIVEVINSSGPQLEGNDGLGDWNIDWNTWKAGNVNA